MNEESNKKEKSGLDKFLNNKVCAFALLIIGLLTASKAIFLIMALFAMPILFNEKGCFK